MDCWTIWFAGLLDYWFAGSLDYSFTSIAGLLVFWIDGLLICWIAGLGFLDCWTRVSVFESSNGVYDPAGSNLK